MLDHLFMHIVIAVLDDQLNIAIRMQTLAHLFGDIHHLTFTRFKPVAVKIANDVMHVRAIDRPFDAGEVVEALIALGLLRALICRDFGMNAGRQRQRVHHHPFRRARVDVIADDADIHRRRIEILELKFTHAAAVNGIGPAGIERRNVEMLRPFAHLFIRGEGDADIPVRHLVVLQHRQRGHDLGHPGFIIGPQQRFAVGSDQRLPEQLVQHGEHHRGEHFVANAQRNIAAAIVLNNLRIHVFTAKIR